MQHKKVIQRLAHFFCFACFCISDLQHARMHPVVTKGAIIRCFRLGSFVFMMRKHQVRAAPVNIERQTQILVAHGRALNVPTGAPFPPRGIPRRLTWFRGFPQRKIKRVTLSVFKTLSCGTKLTMSRFHVIYIAPRKLSVRRIRAHRKVHITLYLVGVSFFNERAYQLNHLINFFGSFRTHRGI